MDAHVLLQQNRITLMTTFAVCSILLTSCNEPVTSATRTSVPDAAATARAAGNAPLSVNVIARGITLAMADVELRHRLRDDLRDSPYRMHALPLQSYLAGRNGGLLTLAAAEALNLSTIDFVALVSQLPNLAIVMERPLDRVQWTGQHDIIVYGAPIAGRGRIPSNGRVQGFDIEGHSVDVPLTAFAPFPYLAVLPLRLQPRRRVCPSPS